MIDWSVTRNRLFIIKTFEFEFVGKLTRNEKAAPVAKH
jgi:hypothetical protein